MAEEKKSMLGYDAKKVKANWDEAKRAAKVAVHGKPGELFRPNKRSAAESLQELQDLLDQGQITPQDYETQKDRILGRI